MNTPEGAVSVVNPQGTEETGDDRPAAPIFRLPEVKRWFASVWDLWRRARPEQGGSNAAPEPNMIPNLIAPRGATLTCPSCDDVIGVLRIDVYGGMRMRAEQVDFEPHQHCNPGDSAVCRKCGAPYLRSFVDKALRWGQIR